jgi:carboxypeptidase Q
VVALIALLAAPPYSPEIATRLIGAALSDGVAYARVADLSDSIGPRLSGSPGADAAVKWAVQRLRDDGLEVRTETVKVPHWVRGEERAEVLPARGRAGHMLAITALGGSPPTAAGGVTAEVIEVRSIAEVQALGEKARGKIVFFNHNMSAAGGKTGYGETSPLRNHGPAEAAKFGAAAALVRSLATASLRDPHTGATTFDDGAPKIPAAAISVEDAELLHRLLQRGPVQVRLGLGCRILADVESANVIAEVRGREKAEEIVLLGAHLDSWDLAQGAVDDGAGVAIVMEAARLIAQLPQHPRRTVRVVLFMNEENGLAGGKAYAQAHAGEADRHVAALESDAGAGRPVSIGLRAGDGAQALLAPWLAPLEPLGAADFGGEAGGADIGPLGAYRVPFVGVQQDVSRYFDYHHSAADTLDKIRPADLSQTAAAVTWVAYALAEMPQPLPRPAGAAPRGVGAASGRPQ